MNPEQEVQRLIKEHGGVLTRGRKHQVYKFPSGQTFTMASTPSDVRAAANQLTDLRKALGLQDPERGKPGERRERVDKPGRAGQPKVEASRLDSPLADQLRGVGIVENSLRSQLAEEKERSGRLAECFTSEYNKLVAQQALCGNCWWCRLKRLVRDNSRDMPGFI